MFDVINQDNVLLNAVILEKISQFLKKKKTNNYQ